MPHRRLLHLLKRLKNERDPQRREEIIALGRKALLKWFLVGARNLLKRVIPLNKRDQNFVSKHREDFQIISNAQASDEERKKALLKRGGAGFLGGTIIRHLQKWEEKKKVEHEDLKIFPWEDSYIEENAVKSHLWWTRMSYL